MKKPPDSSFDAESPIFLMSVLRALVEMAKLVKKTGKIILTPNIYLYFQMKFVKKSARVN